MERTEPILFLEFFLSKFIPSLKIKLFIQGTIAIKQFLMRNNFYTFEYCIKIMFFSNAELSQ